MSKSTTSYRSVRKSHFTQISNDLLNDNSLPLEAKGLLSIFLSNNDEWELQMSEIIKRSKNGRDAHYSALKKLIKAGYIARIEFKQMNNNQFLHLEYIFSDSKEDVINGIKDAQKVASENEQIIILTYKDIENHQVEFSVEDIEKKPFTENPDTENPNTESQYINNIKYNNTNNNNTKYNNDMNDMSDNNLNNNNSYHTDHYLKEYYLNNNVLNSLPKLKSILNIYNAEDIKIILDTLWKAVSSYEKECDKVDNDKGYFAVEDIEDEIVNVIKRFTGSLKAKNESVSNMQSYLMTSFKNALRDNRDKLINNKREDKGTAFYNWLEE